MKTKSRIGLAALLFVAGFGLVALSGPSRAEVGEDLGKVVKDIAAEVKKGNDAGAKKMSAATVKNVKLIDEISDLMAMYRGTDKGGLGIEAGLKKASAKNAEELGNLTLAMGHLTLAKGWDKNSGKKTKVAWNGFTEDMNKAAKDLVAAKNDDAAAKAASKVLRSCVNCHSVFKE